METQQEVANLLHLRIAFSSSFSSFPFLPFLAGLVLLSFPLRYFQLLLPSLAYAFSLLFLFLLLLEKAPLLLLLSLNLELLVFSHTSPKIASIHQRSCDIHYSDLRFNRSIDQLIPRHKYCSYHEQSEASYKARRLMSSEDRRSTFSSKCTLYPLSLDCLPLQ